MNNAFNFGINSLKMFNPEQYKVSLEVIKKLYFSKIKLKTVPITIFYENDQLFNKYVFFVF